MRDPHVKVKWIQGWSAFWMYELWMEIKQVASMCMCLCVSVSVCVCVSESWCQFLGMGWENILE